jgi:hypothetical protein
MNRGYKMDRSIKGDWSVCFFLIAFLLTWLGLMWIGATHGELNAELKELKRKVAVQDVEIKMLQQTAVYAD